MLGWLLLGCLAVRALAQSPPPININCDPEFEDNDPDEFYPELSTARLDPFSFLLGQQHLTTIYVLTYGHILQFLIMPDQTITIAKDGTFQANLSQQSAQQLVTALCGPEYQGVFAGPSVRPGTVATPTVAAGQYNGLVAMADFNGDGVPDSASLSPTGITVTLYNADQSVLSTANYPVNGIGSSVGVADFNRDGRIDLAVTETDPSGQGNVVVLPGNGDGTFGPAANFAAGSYPFYLAAGDFNGDGSPDLAVTGLPAGFNGPGTVAVLLGHGDGTFSPAVTYPVGPFPATIVAADFNGDGKLDLAELDAAAGSVNKVWVLAGNGDGTFQPAVSTPTGTGNGYLQYADLNQDGKLDLIIADQMASAMAVMMGKGDGTFQPPSNYAIGAQPVSIAVLPLGDGNTSLATADNVSSNIFFSFAATDGTIISPQLQKLGSNPAAVAVSDLNGDQRPDLVVTDPGAGSLYVELANSNGQFSAPVSYPLGESAGPLAMTDLNRDGKPDAVVADGNGIEVLLGNGDGTFQPYKAYPAGGSLGTPAIADFNGDGKPDVAAANTSTGGVSLFLGNGDGTLQSAIPIGLPGGAMALSAVAGDFNGDGKPDLMVAYTPADPTQPGGLAVLLGNGDGTFQAPVEIVLPGMLVQQSIGFTPTAALQLADVNGDGIPDAITAIEGDFSNLIAVLPGNGDGTFQTPILTNTATSPPMIAITDLNGDGIPDLLLADCCGLSEAGYLVGNGDGTFQPEAQFPSGPSPEFIAVADLNGDGEQDAAIVGQVQTPNYGTLTLLYWNGSPTRPAAANARPRRHD